MSAESVWTAWLLRIQLFLIFIMIIAIAGHKFSILPFRMAFPSFGVSLFIIFVCGLVGLIAVLLGIVMHHSEWVKPAFIALIIGVLPVVVILTVVGPANVSVPQIHDISTDLDNPPVFNVAKNARAPSDNSLQHEGEEIAALQRKAYPNVKPIDTALSSSEAIQRSLAVVENLGWKLHDVNEAAGIIEAYDETRFFGFKDDVVIRVKSTAQGSRVDLRSVSRVGKSDLGANAKRIMQFAEQFEQEK